MNLKMELRQQQKLSPQMIQTMKIIQMSSLELRDYLTDVAMDNPTKNNYYRLFITDIEGSPAFY